MLDFIAKISEIINNMGSTLMVPLMIAIIGLIVKLNLKEALKSGIMVGVGLIGINLVMNLVWDNVTPVANILVEKFDLTLDTIDAGWAVIAGAAFSTAVGTFIIPFAALINVVMLVTKCTKTLDIDIWNYWQFAFGGSVVAASTGSIIYGFIAAALLVVLTLIISDHQAHNLQFMNFNGIACSQPATCGEGLISDITSKFWSIFDRKKITKNGKEDDLVAKLNNNELFKTLSEPTFLGIILGTLLGLAGGYSILNSLTLGIQMCALMLLLPKVVEFLIMGLQPLSKQTETFLKEKFNGMEINIGMDSAILLGHPTTLAVSLLMVPIMLLMAMLLPGNQVIPMADLASTAYLVAYATCVHKGNFLRVLIDGVIMMVPMLYIATYFAPIVTTILGYSSSVSAISAGSVAFYLADIIFHIGGPIMGVALAFVLMAVPILLNRKWLKKQNNK